MNSDFFFTLLSQNSGQNKKIQQQHPNNNNMKSYPILIIVALTVLATSVSAVDTEPPGYSNFDFNPKTVGHEEKVTCTVTLTDDESGVKYAIASFITSSGISVVDCRLSAEKNIVSGDSLNGNYENDCTAKLPDGLDSVEANATLFIFDNLLQMTTVNSLGVLTVTKEPQTRNNGSSSSSISGSNLLLQILFSVLQLLALSNFM